MSGTSVWVCFSVLKETAEEAAATYLHAMTSAVAKNMSVDLEPQSAKCVRHVAVAAALVCLRDIASASNHATARLFHAVQTY